jgi:hypothetical protein
MIYSLVEAQVREAAANPENIDYDGCINWNFVDSDCYMSGVNKFFKDDEAYYEAWGEAVEKVIAEQPVELMNTQLEMDV